MKKDFRRDCYIVNQGLYNKYRTYQTKPGEVIDFNSASLARPYPETFKAVHTKRKLSKNLELRAREEAAKLVGISDPNQVIFGRNTTEALSFAYWLADVDKGNVVTTDAENESIPRIFREHRDHGNTDKSDGWSTFADKEVAERYGGLRTRLKTKSTTSVARFVRSYDLNQVVNRVDGNTRLVVISHVVRNDGRIIDIKEFARRVKQKNPNAYLAIDGAQALGNLPLVDFKDLEKSGIDFYVATPHKTLGSYPLGILYVSDRVKSQIQSLQGRKPEEQLIMAGMIPDIYKIRPNVRCHLNPARYQSLVASIEKLTKEGFLQQNDFSKKAEYLSELKDYFVQGLQSRGIGVNHVGDNYSPAIVSFTISGSRKLVRDIQRRGVFCSYISDTDDVRVSFDITNTKQEVDRYFELFDSLRKKG